MTLSLVLISLLALSTAATTPNDQQPLVPSIASTSKHHHAKPLLDLHRELIEIESISGNENAVGKYLASYLHSLGLTVEMQNVKTAGAADTLKEEDAAPWMLYHGDEDASTEEKTRFNLYAYKGHHRKVDTLLTSHIDTVPPYIPYDVTKPATQSKDRLISGRGSVDAKGSVAAMLTAFSALEKSASDSQSANDEALPSLGLLFVVDEEVGGNGMRAASNTLNTTFKAVIFGEPTEGKLVCGHKGNMGWDIVVEGKAAHSGYPWLGVSANELLIAALGATLSAELPSSEKYGNTTVNIGRMEGGVAGNVVAKAASAKVTVRLAGGEPEDVEAIITKAVNQATEKLLEKGGAVELKFAGHGYGPIDIDCELEGWTAGTFTVNYGTDIPHMSGDHKKYLYGPGSILVAHSDHEAISVADLEQAVEDYKFLVKATA